MKLTKQSLLLHLLSLKADDLSCYEEGGWKGSKFKPDPDDSEYPVCANSKCWDIKSVSSDKQPSVCESLRVKNSGEGWSLYYDDDGPARECTVYTKITKKKDKDDTIRGIPCPTLSPTKSPTIHPSSPTERPTSHPSRSPTKSPIRHPTWSPSRSPSSIPTRRPTLKPTNKHTPSRKPTVSPSQKPTLRPTRSPTSTSTKSPTPSHHHRVIFQGEDVLYVVLLILAILSICCCLWYRHRRSRLQRNNVQSSTIGQLLSLPKRLHVKLISSAEEPRRISNESSVVSVSSHYLNPFSKKSMIPSEKEYLWFETPK